MLPFHINFNNYFNNNNVSCGFILFTRNWNLSEKWVFDFKTMNTLTKQLLVNQYFNKASHYQLISGIKKAYCDFVWPLRNRRNIFILTQQALFRLIHFQSNIAYVYHRSVLVLSKVSGSVPIGNKIKKQNKFLSKRWIVVNRWPSLPIVVISLAYVNTMANQLCLSMCSTALKS